MGPPEQLKTAVLSMAMGGVAFVLCFAVADLYANMPGQPAGVFLDFRRSHPYDVFGLASWFAAATFLLQYGWFSFALGTSGGIGVMSAIVVLSEKGSLTDAVLWGMLVGGVTFVVLLILLGFGPDNSNGGMRPHRIKGWFGVLSRHPQRGTYLALSIVLVSVLVVYLVRTELDASARAHVVGVETVIFASLLLAILRVLMERIRKVPAAAER
jgi:hypothetical protein